MLKLVYQMTSRMFSAVDDPWMWVKDQGHGYEWIDGACIPYFDFDFNYPSEAEAEAAESGDYDKSISAVKAEYDGKPAKFYILQSCGYDSRGGKWKNSYHVLVRGVGYYESGDAFKSTLSADMLAVCDTSVYKKAGKRQLFRLPYTSKKGDDRPLLWFDEANDELYEDLADLSAEQYKALMVGNVEDEELQTVAEVVKRCKVAKAASCLRQREPRSSCGLQSLRDLDEVEPEGCGGKKQFASLTQAEYCQLVRCAGKIKDNSDSTGWSNETRLKFVFSSACIAAAYGLDLRSTVLKALRAFSPNSDSEELDGLMTSYDEHDTEDKANYSCATFFMLAGRGNSKKYKKLRHAIYQRIEAENASGEDDNDEDSDAHEVNTINGDVEIDCGDEMHFEYFDDYKKLIDRYKLNRRSLPGALGLAWVTACITTIEQGGNVMYLTKNRRYDEDDQEQIYFKPVTKQQLKQTLGKMCKFKGLKTTRKSKGGRVETLAELFEYAMYVSEVPCWNEVDFVPFSTTGKCSLGAPGKRTRGVFNLFTGFPMQREIDAANVKPDGRRFEKSKMFAHIKNELCNGDQALFTWFMKWIGHIIQRPGVRTGFMPLIQSEQGGGKDMLGLFISTTKCRTSSTSSTRSNRASYSSDLMRYQAKARDIKPTIS
jgi:hypothetical protein